MRKPLLLVLLSFVLAGAASADLVIPQTASPAILIPAAGDVEGANGTHFRTDVTLVNLRDVPQRVQMLWYPQGGGSSAGVIQRTLTINARSGISSTDFVRNFLFQTGLGSIDVRGVDEENDFDPNARLHAAARIWTPQPNAPNGTTSQTLPAIIPAGARAVQAIFGVRRGDQYRLNVGIVNPNATAQRFRFTLLTSGGASEMRELQLEPFSMDLVQMPGTADVVQILVENLTTPNAYWEAWASSIDNVTGDAWSQMAFPALQ
jgi:hypothetical protein